MSRPSIALALMGAFIVGVPAPASRAETAPGTAAAPLTRAEFLDRQARLFDAWDRDHDGVLSPAEQTGLQREQHAQTERPKRPLMHPSK